MDASRFVHHPMTLSVQLQARPLEALYGLDLERIDSSTFCASLLALGSRLSEGEEFPSKFLVSPSSRRIPAGSLYATTLNLTFSFALGR